MTVQDLIDEVKDDLGLNTSSYYGDTRNDSSNIINKATFFRYINNSLSEGAAMICKQYEDYYLTISTVPLTIGQNSYALPADIFMNKIRRIFVHDNSNYTNPGNSLQPNRIIDLNDVLLYNNTASTYPESYLINDLTDPVLLIKKPYITFFPSNINYTKYITFMYIRKPNSVSSVDDIIDFDYTRFIVADVTAQCIKKLVGHPLSEYFTTKRETVKDLMLAALSNRVIDNTNTMKSSRNKAILDVGSDYGY